jgi:hypothetical protein
MAVAKIILLLAATVGLLASLLFSYLGFVDAKMQFSDFEGGIRYLVLLPGVIQAAWFGACVYRARTFPQLVIIALVGAPLLLGLHVFVSAVNAHGSSVSFWIAQTLELTVVAVAWLLMRREFGKPMTAALAAETKS